MSKGRGARGREEKKPKAEKKPAVVASTFLRPQAADGKTTAAKQSKK
jgi:hypothetical protein